MHRVILPVLGFLVLAAGGCAHISSGRSTTAGQELADLDRARAAGAVSEAEYAALRKAIGGRGP